MNFKQKFEPKEDRIIHGAGQLFPDDFRDYWQAVGENKPLLYMTYTGLRGVEEGWFSSIKKEIEEFPNVLFQIGLSMTKEKEGSPFHYEGEVAAGKYDENINKFCRGVKELNLPVFVRLGYEFNGLYWNGYLPKTYIEAWRHIAGIIRKNGVDNLAMVWCYSPDGEENYLDYYPGDDDVDWWGIDVFSAKQLKYKVTDKFMQDAAKHRKPVMIGESSARYVGTLAGQKSWDRWFKPFFTWIEQNPVIKAFCYINWNWAKHKQWEKWGDCRISQNEIVRRNYIEEMKKPKYVHNLPISEFLKLVS